MTWHLVFYVLHYDIVILPTFYANFLSKILREIKMCLLLIDLDECLSNPCGNTGQCVQHVNGFICQCLHGYTGITCQTGDRFERDVE